MTVFKGLYDFLILLIVDSSYHPASQGKRKLVCGRDYFRFIIHDVISGLVMSGVGAAQKTVFYNVCSWWGEL